MIIRISHEGQYRLDGDLIGQLEKLDAALVAAVDADDEERYRQAFESLLAFVRDHGDPLADDDLTGSDVILPPADLSLNEAAGGIDAEGLIPG